MGFFGKHNNASGRDPEFGAIFMSNSATLRECFQSKLFGLPSSHSQFVEQVKTGMVLFLFEYEKRELHGVFKASCDGALNIAPNAFSSSEMQFPAQVKFVPIWYCRPLLESSFRDAIRENYFSANKFNFGLSENQVYKLLYLFSMRKLEPEFPGRQLTRKKDLKSEGYPLGKVESFFHRGMHVGTAKNEQVVGDNILPTITHKYQEGYLQHNREVENIGFNASDIVVNDQGRESELAVNTTSGYFGDYLALKDECRFTGQYKEHYMGIRLRPNIPGGYSGSPSDKIRVHGDGSLSVSDRLMNGDLGKTGQRMVFSNNSPGLHHLNVSYDSARLHHSNVNLSVFYSKPILESDSLVQNQLRPTSAMLHPIKAQISNNSSATQGDASSESTLPYDPDSSCINYSQPSSVRHNDSSKSMLRNTSPSNNYGRSSLSSQPCLNRTEPKDMNRCHGDSYGFLDPVLHGSNKTCMPFNAAWNSDNLAAESVVYEACDSIPFLKPSSAPLTPSNIANDGRVHEPFSSFFHSYKSCVGNDVHSIALQENLGCEMTPQKKNETCTPVVPWANGVHTQVQYGDPLNNEYDIECYGNSQSYNSKSGYPKNKSSVFSRLSFVQDVNKQENGNNIWHGEYDFHTSIDEVMEMVRGSHNQWGTKRKLKPSVKPNNAKSLRDKTQIVSSRLKSDSSESTLENVSLDLTTASGANMNETAEEIVFVDFKRRSKVRKVNDETKTGSSNESEGSGNLAFVQQKRRKLIRPNFSKSTTSDDKGIDPGVSQKLQVSLSHESCNPKDVSESCCALVQTEDNIKTDEEVQNFVCQRHSEDMSSNHAGGCVCSKGEGKAGDGAHTVVNDGSECLENFNNKNTLSSSSCEDESCHVKEGLCMKDGINSVPLVTESLHSLCQEHHADKVICADRGIITEEGMSKDGGSSCTIEVKDGSYSLQNSGNENAPIAASCEQRNFNT